MSKPPISCPKWQSGEINWVGSRALGLARRRSARYHGSSCRVRQPSDAPGKFRFCGHLTRERVRENIVHAEYWHKSFPRGRLMMQISCNSYTRHYIKADKCPSSRLVFAPVGGASSRSSPHSLAKFWTQSAQLRLVDGWDCLVATRMRDETATELHVLRITEITRQRNHHHQVHTGYIS